MKKLKIIKKKLKISKPNSLMIHNSRESGQLMVELMVSMSLLVIGIMGILAVLSQSLSLNRVAANQYIGANLAAEGIEVTKNILDSNFINGDVWNIGFANSLYRVQFDSTSLNSSNPNAFLQFNPSPSSVEANYSYSGGTPTRFRRVITIDQVSPDEIKVVSTVTWEDRGGIDFTIDVEDRFKNWRTAP